MPFQASEFLETRNIVNGILAKHTGKTIKEVNKATAFDNYMNAEKSVEFGICDRVVSNLVETPLQINFFDTKE